MTVDWVLECQMYLNLLSKGGGIEPLTNVNAKALPVGSCRDWMFSLAIIVKTKITKHNINNNNKENKNWKGEFEHPTKVIVSVLPVGSR